MRYDAIADPVVARERHLVTTIVFPDGNVSYLIRYQRNWEDLRSGYAQQRKDDLFRAQILLEFSEDVMNDWTLSNLPVGGRIAVSAILCAIGVGFLFSTAQINFEHGGMSYGAVVRNYYGPPKMRDDLDATWERRRAELVQRWEAGRRGVSAEKAEGGVATDLDDLDAPAPSPYDGLLARARSVGHLERLIEQEHKTELELKLGIPSLGHLVSLGHTHTFGHVAFLAVVSLRPLTTSLPWTWKGLIAAIPHVGIMIGYPSALATRLWAPEFGLLLMLGGFLMAAGFFAGFVVCVCTTCGSEETDRTMRGVHV
jgi:hypothetical protein